MAQFGIVCDSDTSGSESESDDSSEFSNPAHTQSEVVTSFSKDDILSILKSGQWNWFEVVSEAEERRVNLASQYQVIVSELAEPESTILSQSHAAFLKMEHTEAPRQNVLSQL